MNRYAASLMLAGLLLHSALLPAALFHSNSLGQELQRAYRSDAKTSEWIIDVDRSDPHNQMRKLYHNQIVVETVAEQMDQDQLLRTQTHYDTDAHIQKTVETTFSANLLKQKLIRTADQTTLLLYEYDEGRLVEIKRLEEGILRSITTYYRGSDGSLSGVRRIDTQLPTVQSMFTTDGKTASYSQQQGSYIANVQLFSPTILLEQRWVDDQLLIDTTAHYDDLEQLVVTETDSEGLVIEKTYAPDGLLVKQVEQSPLTSTITTTFAYDPKGRLDWSAQVQEQQRIERWFKDGVLQDLTQWSGQEPIRAVRYLADGTSIVTLFENGRPYADVTYAPDGKRVLSIEYRKERSW
ncbi:MAG: hypothetical protein ACOXZ4_03145 [Sphaerochaetaceae bacterium]